MDPVNFDLIKSCIIKNVSIFSQNVRQFVLWSGRLVSAGCSKLLPAIQYAWNQCYLLMKELYSLATTAIGTTAATSAALFAIGLSASRVANRVEYQDPDQRAVRAFWRTVAAFAFIGSATAAGMTVAMSVGVV